MVAGFEEPAARDAEQVGPDFPLLSSAQASGVLVLEQRSAPKDLQGICAHEPTP